MSLSSFRRLPAIFVALLLLGGCQTQVREVDSDDPTIATTVGASARDLDRVTSELIQEMLQNPIIAQVDPSSQRLVMRVGNITDNTLTSFPIPEMVNLIRTELNRSGRIVTQDRDFEGAGGIQPEFEIRGLVSQRNNRSGNDTRIDYYIQLRLIEIATGIAQWEGDAIYTRLAGSDATW